MDRRSQYPHATISDNRRSPPAPLKLRGSYYSVNTAPSLSRIPSSPLPPLPTSYSGAELATPHAHSLPEGGYTRLAPDTPGLEDTAQTLSSQRSPTNQTTTAEQTNFLPVISSSPPKLNLSFDNDQTESGSNPDISTPLNHPLSSRSSSKPYSSLSNRNFSPDRLVTSPSPVSTTEVRARTRRTSTGMSQLRRSSAVYKRRMSFEVTDSGSSESGKSTIDSREDHDSGFHESFDESLRSKQPSPGEQSFVAKSDSSSHLRDAISSPRRPSEAVTPERAPLIPSEGRITPITLVDPGVTKKPVPLTLREIEKMETFKETFSTNLFENSASPKIKRKPVLSPKPIFSAGKGKVLTPAEFEKLRQQAEDDSDDDEEEEDLARDESYQADLEKQRRRQQAALSIYRQQMTKVVGTNPSPQLVPPRPVSQIGPVTDDDEHDEIPLGILMVHGFPQTNNRPANSPRESAVKLEQTTRTPSPGNLPAFAKNLPADPYGRSLPRATSVYDLRPSSRAVTHQPINGAVNSAPAVPLLQSYETRQRKGAMFLDPNVEMPNQMLAPEPSYFSPVPGQYEAMAMQPVPAQGVIQYVPVVVGSPVGTPLTSMHPPTLIQELHDRQQLAAQHRLASRMSQYNLHQPQPMYPTQPSPQPVFPRPVSVYNAPRRSFYDQKSIYSSASQQPTARPKLPSTNPAHRMTIANTNSQPGRYRASTYGGSGLGVTQSLNRRVSPVSPDDDDEGWEALRRKKEEMQMRRISKMQTAA